MGDDTDAPTEATRPTAAPPSARGRRWWRRGCHHRGDAKACTLAVERFYTNNFTYVGSGSACNAASPVDGEQQYVIAVVSVAATTYAVTATPVSGSCSGDCVRIALDGTQTVY